MSDKVGSRNQASMLGMSFILISCFLWSADTLFRLPLLKHVDSAMIVFFEHVFACVLLLPFFLKVGSAKLFLNKKDQLSLCFIGVLGSALATLFLTASYRLLNPSVAILLQKVQPIFTVLGARVFLKERFRANFYFWLLIAIVGATLLSYPNLTAQSNAKPLSIMGILLALFASFAWGTSTVFGRKLTTEYHFMVTTYWRYLWGILALILLFSILKLIPFNEFAFLLFGFKPDSFSIATSAVAQNPSLLWLILYIGLFSGTIAMSFYYAGLSRTPASVAAALELFFPLMAVVLNWVFLGQKLILIQMIGGMLLILSSFYITKPKE